MQDETLSANADETPVTFVGARSVFIDTIIYWSLYVAVLATIGLWYAIALWLLGIL